ncbi:MAG: hypothetical protein JJU28_00860 [Cyclobacteriaceae bacterium]|nr:hypothetical protein [Cyclobacteriaceae bacterium]
MNKLIIVLVTILFFGFSVKEDTVSIKVDTTSVVGKLEPFWARQIIHPTEFLLTEWGKDFVNMLAESGAARQYIRIYNQPERAFRLDDSGKITYDWSHFDQMAEIILATGNKLNVVFFGMPYELALYPESVKKRPYGGLVCISPPKDYVQWQDLCADFTKHVISKYGWDQVKDWTFRCWNEPDHRGFWHESNQKEYLVLYDHFAHAVKSVNPAIKIGGPALTSTGTYNNPENFKFFLEHVANGINHATGKKGSPIDYLAVHTYGGSGGGGGPGRDFPDLDYMLEQQFRLADMRDAYPVLRNVPIHIEEWGISSGGTTGVSTRPTADVRNSEYGAAFLTSLVARHIDIRQTNDRLLDGFTFCSSGYETIAESDFMGYRTLHTKSGFHKPILNAYKLLNRLGDNLLRIDASSANQHITSFATKDENKISIVVSNYQHDKIYGEGQSYSIDLNIKHEWKPNAKVLINHWRIDQQHSNAYTIFKELGSPKLPYPMQVDAIKSRMDLEMMKKPETLAVRDMKGIKFDLPCNAVSLIEIEIY